MLFCYISCFDKLPWKKLTQWLWKCGSSADAKLPGIFKTALLNLNNGGITVVTTKVNEKQKKFLYDIQSMENKRFLTTFGILNKIFIPHHK